MISTLAEPDAQSLRGAVSTEWDRYAKEWVEHNPQELWRRHSDAVNAALLARWLPPGTCRRILKTDLFDEGVSEGLYATLAERCESVTGIDVSPAIMRAATHRFRSLKATGADVRRLPFESGAFDVIVSLSTLDHFSSQAEVETGLSELYRVLEPGGTLIITLDNLANPVVALRNALPYRLTHAAGLVPYPVGKTKGPRGAARAVRAAGFEVAECTAIMHAPRVMTIPALNALGRLGMERARRALARAAMSFEILGHLPAWRFTGHFVAIRAVKLEGARQRA